MPDKTLKVVTYAAGASLAAITLIYVFGPTYFLDSDTSRPANNAFSARRKSGGVGLSNPANDCFINSVLQALAGLGDLRLYLIRELHRRSLDAESVYAQPVPADAFAEDLNDTPRPRFGKDIPGWKLEGLQRGCVTKSLKDILDALNERPIYKKTISAAPFVRALEEAFRQRISRQQQDAQEFLQVVAERLCDEYHAGRRARWFAKRTAAPDDEPPVAQSVAAEILGPGVPRLPGLTGKGGILASGRAAAGSALGGIEYDTPKGRKRNMEDQEAFPLEGRFESQIECLTCGFKPRPTTSTFCTLTLNVPRVPSTTLGACFDGMFKTEYIDDFKCEKCRLLHALALFELDRQRSTSDAARAEAEAAVERLRFAIDNDPEKPPEGVTLPDLRYAPKRRIARHIRMTEFPNILAIHLSRSIFDVSHASQKNSAKVAFPNELPLGGLLEQRKYKLLGVVTHKGSHHSGHYESFRRQNIYPPFSNPSTFQASDVYSRRTSPASTPLLHAQGQPSEKAAPFTPLQEPLGQGSGTSPPLPSPRPITTFAESSCTLQSTGSRDRQNTAGLQCPTTAPAPPVGSPDVANRVPNEASSRSSTLRTSSSPWCATAPNTTLNNAWLPSTRCTPDTKPKQKKQQARWWRISDDKVKEASTRDVLGMQREVYLLFYELERLHMY